MSIVERLGRFLVKLHSISNKSDSGELTPQAAATAIALLTAVEAEMLRECHSALAEQAAIIEELVGLLKSAEARLGIDPIVNNDEFCERICTALTKATGKAA